MVPKPFEALLVVVPPNSILYGPTAMNLGLDLPHVPGAGLQAGFHDRDLHVTSHDGVRRMQQLNFETMDLSLLLLHHSPLTSNFLDK